MRLSHLILGGAALAGAVAFTLPARAGDLFVRTPGGDYIEADVVYSNPYGTYAVPSVPAFPDEAPRGTIVVREVPPGEMPRGYVPAPGYGPTVYAAPESYGECRDLVRQTRSGRLVRVGTTCD